MHGPEDLERAIAEAEEELTRLNSRRAEIIARLEELRRKKSLQAKAGQQIHLELSTAKVTSWSADEEKIALFLSLFRGREDVHPLRFESAKTGRAGYSPACANEWAPEICLKPKIKCGDCKHQAFIPSDQLMARQHLLGRAINGQEWKDYTAGVYPLLPDETCWFLAIDFDKDTWQDDTVAFLETCQAHDIPAALERSRSGNGGHIWIFFDEPIPAKIARRLGSFLLTRAMEQRPEIGFESYDRLFPSQDTLPKGGFGNLIALPLQQKPRKNGSSVFVNKALEPYEDQWEYLSSVRRLSHTDAEGILAEAAESENILGVRIAISDEDDSPWDAPPSRQRQELSLSVPLPEKLSLVLGNQIYIPKGELTPPLRNRIIRLAAFQNPEFYRAQAMRFSTFDKPRIIGCAEDFFQPYWSATRLPGRFAPTIRSEQHRGTNSG